MWKCIFYDFVKSYHHRFQFYCYHNISAKRFHNLCVGKFSKYLVFLLTFTNKSPNAHIHCVKSVRIRSFFWSVLTPNAGKYGPEKL